MEPNKFFMIFSPSWLLISFLLYWPLFFKYIKEGKSKQIILLRFYGAALFGAVPLILVLFLKFSLSDVFGLRFDISIKPWLWLVSLVLGLLIILANYFASRNPVNLKEFPQIRDQLWSTGLIFQNVISWIIYLIGYEFLFRGLMLFPLVPVLGFWPAAIFGTVLYSLSHYPKHIREAIGAIPLGIILVWITWECQSIWPAIWIHICLAVSNSLLSLYHHPGIHLQKTGTQKY